MASEGQLVPALSQEASQAEKEEGSSREEAQTVADEGGSRRPSLAALKGEAQGAGLWRSSHRPAMTTGYPADTHRLAVPASPPRCRRCITFPPPPCFLPAVRYGVTDVPPWWLCLLLGFQSFLTMLGSTVLIPLLLVPAMGGSTKGTYSPPRHCHCRGPGWHVCMATPHGMQQRTPLQHCGTGSRLQLQACRGQRTPRQRRVMRPRQFVRRHERGNLHLLLLLRHKHASADDSGRAPAHRAGVCRADRRAGGTKNAAASLRLMRAPLAPPPSHRAMMPAGRLLCLHLSRAHAGGEHPEAADLCVGPRSLPLHDESDPGRRDRLRPHRPGPRTVQHFPVGAQVRCPLLLQPVGAACCCGNVGLLCWALRSAGPPAAAVPPLPSNSQFVVPLSPFLPPAGTCRPSPLPLTSPSWACRSTTLAGRPWASASSWACR